MKDITVQRPITTARVTRRRTLNKVFSSSKAFTVSFLNKNRNKIVPGNCYLNFYRANHYQFLKLNPLITQAIILNTN